MLLTNPNYVLVPSTILGTVNTMTETLTPLLNHPTYLGPLTFGSEPHLPFNTHTYVLRHTHAEHLPASTQVNIFFLYVTFTYLYFYIEDLETKFP